jgi:hypothetical protein
VQAMSSTMLSIHPCYPSYPFTGPQPLVDSPSGSPCPGAHAAGGYEDQHCTGAHDLPWLHIIHRLLMCPAGPGRPPIFQVCSEMLLLTLGWPHYHCCLVILFADLNIRPWAPASSCAPSAPLCTDFLCLLADPLRLEVPPLGFPVTGWICLQPQPVLV